MTSLLIHCSLHLKIVVVSTHPLVGKLHLAGPYLLALHYLGRYLVSLVVEVGNQRLILVGHVRFLFSLRSENVLMSLLH